MSASKTLEELKADTQPGRCILCWDKLPPSGSGRARVVCDSPDCEQHYSRIYRADVRAKSQAARVAAKKLRGEG